MGKWTGKKAGVCLLAAVLGIGGITASITGKEPEVVLAGKETTSKDIQQQIDAVNRERMSAEAEKEQLEKDIEELEKKKENALEYVETLDRKLTKLAEKIEQNESDMAVVQEEIEELQVQKEEAEADRERQYDTMKKRIKYMYENGSEGYLELLLASNSLSELFNRTEYISRVTSYDQQMLQNYQETCDRIAETQRELDENLQELEEIEESLAQEKKSVDVLMGKKKEQLRKYSNTIQEKSSAIEEQKKLLEEQENELERLLEEQRKKIAEENAASDDYEGDTSGKYRWPLPIAGRISSYFGNRTAPTAGASSYHKGIDIAIPVGTRVLATRAGKVVTATYSTSAGNFVGVYHGNGVYSYYMHCSSLSVEVGDVVSKGQQVALSGNTGISTGPHLHFAIYENGAYVNPLLYVSQ